MKFKQKCLHIVGGKKSGKTALVEWLIGGLKKKGYRVGALKHSMHNHPIDREGSDSYRMQKAGAQPTVFWTKEGVGIFFGKPDEFQIEEVLQFVYKDIDILIIESFSAAEGPKIVIDDGSGGREQFKNVIAVVSEHQPERGLPVFGKYDPQLIRFIEDYFNLKS
ncbi:MAG: molybdopterin-guanine dinucleotide biosynthesis protein B [Calditrichaeota bacterium]|nr:molybdopterin-guanine dinucleotide biosynthesis protein B [Calditrichota bacterium]